MYEFARRHSRPDGKRSTLPSTPLLSYGPTSKAIPRHACNFGGPAVARRTCPCYSRLSTSSHTNRTCLSFSLPPSRPPTSACTFVPGHFISSRFVQSSRTLNPALTSERRLRNYLTGLTHTYALTFTLLHLQTLAYPALTCQPRHRRFQLGRSRHLTSSRARTPLRHLTSLQCTLTSFSPMPYT
jgi:hypothetical protein